MNGKGAVRHRAGDFLFTLVGIEVSSGTYSQNAFGKYILHLAPKMCIMGIVVGYVDRNKMGITLFKMIYPFILPCMAATLYWLCMEPNFILSFLI